MEFIPKKGVIVLWLVICLFLSFRAEATLFFVDQHHVLANDNNPGTEQQPFETVQRGLDLAIAGDTVFIKNGIYDLSGYTKDLLTPIAIIGEDKNETILQNMGTLTITAAAETDLFVLRNVKFTSYQESLINLSAGSTETIDGVHISDCIFDSVICSSKRRIIQARYDVDSAAVITNINISNCEFLGALGPGVKFIYLYQGILSNINITNNRFLNLYSTSETRGATAIYIGNNSTLTTTKDVIISGNFIDHIYAHDVGEVETHGVLAYGENLKIYNNAVRNMNPGQDHEALYIKGSNSLIANNVLINCTSNQGAIAIKGGGKSFYDTIRNNRIQSDQSGRGLYSAGPEYIVMENNYVKNTYYDSQQGMFIYAANGSSCSMKGNYSQSGGVAAYMNEVSGGEITNNTLISYSAEPIKLVNSIAIYINGNLEYTGWPEDSPTAIATANVIQGEAPLQVNFTGESSFDPNGDIISWDWNFHDGTTSALPNPSHNYTEARTYMATLTVTDSDGFKDLDYIIINVERADLTVGANQLTQSEPINIQVSPNPFHYTTNISIENITGLQTTVNIYNIHGDLIKHTSFQPSTGIASFVWQGDNSYGQRQPAGIYVINTLCGGHEQSKKVLLR